MPVSSILIAEDDPGVAELVREGLEEIGCACEAVATGKAALAALRERRYDLLVLDYSLPDMRADQLLLEPSLPPFVITTGRGDEATAVRLMRAGARDYVIKDSSFLAELPLAVARVLRELETESRLAEARASLEARLRENDAMLREIHHRVKNNLQIVSSLVRLQTPLDADDRVLGILVDIQGRISAMSLIHETLYESENLAQVDFLAYLGALARSLESAIGPADRSLRLNCCGDPIELPIDRAVPLGLIANELLTNAIKHAFPPSWGGEASVSAVTGRAEAGPAYLEVEDNGVGLTEAAGASGGLGLKLVRILSEQLGGRLSVGAPSGGGGTRWRIELGD
jgi:two-component sensor histidine kinase